MSTEFREELRLFLYALPFYFYPFLLLPGGGVPRRGGRWAHLSFLTCQPLLPLFFSFPRTRISLFSFFPASVCAHMLRARIYIMYPLPPPFILPFKFMFYNILINQPVTKLFQKYGEKVIDIFGLNRNMPYFCIRFPRDGKPWNWHSDRNGVGTPTFFFSFALIPTKNTAF